MLQIKVKFRCFEVVFKTLCLGHPFHVKIIIILTIESTFYLLSCFCFFRWRQDRTIKALCYIAKSHLVFKRFLVSVSAKRRWRFCPAISLCTSRGSVKHQRAGCLFLRADSEGQLGLAGAVSRLSSCKRLQSYQSQNPGGSTGQSSTSPNQECAKHRVRYRHCLVDVR